MSSIRFDFRAEINNNDTVRKLNNFVNLYFYDEVTLFEIPFYKSKTMQREEANTVINETEITDTVDNYRYFMFKDGGKTGLEFNSLLDVAGKSLDVVSYSRKLFNISDEMINNPNDVLKTKYRLENSEVEEYTPKMKYDNSYSDLTTLYFHQEFPMVNFSLSKKLDIERNAKLTKVKFTFLKTNNENPLKEMEFEIKSTPQKNTDTKILNFIEKASKQLEIY